VYKVYILQRWRVGKSEQTEMEICERFPVPNNEKAELIEPQSQRAMPRQLSPEKLLYREGDSCKQSQRRIGSIKIAVHVKTSGLECKKILKDAFHSISSALVRLWFSNLIGSHHEALYPRCGFCHDRSGTEHWRWFGAMRRGLLR